ncbi:CCR4-NOT transcription complex subunit 9-like isoform X2 [Carica papaya]|uniref:CCR4-NOT transcription complex subunit 9-like isoform X2 n=1 Tax=Carica papaya TaxID=3649 RepID=UPI000B8D0237|nr:CCR4-NOT transcription complex subunit 9-like isoform X2 [Carica papaya]
MNRRGIMEMSSNFAGSFPGDPSGSGGASSSGTKPPGLQAIPSMALLGRWIQGLQFSATRELALHNLAKNREACEEYAVVLWNSFGTVSILLQEITIGYQLLSTQMITDRIANRVCNALALLQCLAVHPETRPKFIKANMPSYVFPFLNQTKKEKPYEHIRLTSLGVFGALVKGEDPAAIHFLIVSDVLPYCLHAMDIGDELSKTVATFVLQKILLSNEGLKYCCAIADRFFSVCRALERMLDKLPKQPSPKLLKLIVCCYLRLSETPRACDGLRSCLPVKLTDTDFVGSLCSEEPSTIDYLHQLLKNVSNGRTPTIWGPI